MIYQDFEFKFLFSRVTNERRIGNTIRSYGIIFLLVGVLDPSIVLIFLAYLAKILRIVLFQWSTNE